jgi:hypothetical protein
MAAPDYDPGSGDPRGSVGQNVDSPRPHWAFQSIRPVRGTIMAGFAICPFLYQRTGRGAPMALGVGVMAGLVPAILYAPNGDKFDQTLAEVGQARSIGISWANVSSAI